VRVRFPRELEQLSDIVRKNTGLAARELDQDIMNAAVRRFIELRDQAIATDAQKPPSTSELIDWVRILHWNGVSIDDLGDATALPPYWRTLFKTYPDLEAFEVKAQAQAGGSPE
jgi:MoxR-like ATPase